MSYEVVIVLPAVIVINGASDAPEKLRSLNTAKWDADFCLTALIHGISQKLGDTWSVGKKDEKKLKKVHESLVNGNWTTKARTGASAAKFDEAIKKLNTEALFNKLSPEQLSALAAMINADK